MSPHFYLFLPSRSNESTDLNTLELSWIYEGENSELKLAQGLLSDTVVATLNHHITVVLPGEDVLFLTAEIPGKNKLRIQQAVPYVLEDSLIDDVDELYFAINKSNKDPSDNQYGVSVINRDYFESIIHQLENAGIHADIMIADYLLLAENNTLLFDGQRVLFNGNHLKFASSIVTSVEGEIKLDDGLAGNEEIKLIYCDKETAENSNLEKLVQKVNLNKELCDVHPLLCLVKNSSGDKSINLLQGAYKKKKNWSQTTKTWLPVAALFLVWLSVQGGLFIVDYFSLSKQNKKLNADITKIYKKTFPKSRRIVDAKAQMQSKLTSLRKRKGQSGRSFTEMLSGSASIFSRTEGLKIKSLRYYDGRINIELEIASLQALDNLKSQLNKEKGYQVEIQNASSGKETVTARIQIIGAEL